MTGTFDARVVKKTESKSGLFLLLELAGDDYYGSISEMPPGTLLKLQYEELDGNTGAQKEQIAGPGNTAESQSRSEPSETLESATATRSKPRRPFSELPLSQQCAIRCGEARFADYLASDPYSPFRHGDDVADYIRAVCGVDSRSEIKPDTPAGERWQMEESCFQKWLTTQQHKDHVR